MGVTQISDLCLYSEGNKILPCGCLMSLEVPSLLYFFFQMCSSVSIDFSGHSSTVPWQKRIQYLLCAPSKQRGFQWSGRPDDFCGTGVCDAHSSDDVPLPGCAPALSPHPPGNQFVSQGQPHRAFLGQRARVSDRSRACAVIHRIQHSVATRAHGTSISMLINLHWFTFSTFTCQLIIRHDVSTLGVVGLSCKQEENWERVGLHSPGRVDKTGLTEANLRLIFKLMKS